MKTSVFKQLGWFKKNYHFYGFEDTDLGYRFYLNGYKFHLSGEIVYHLYHSNERSEYKNSNLHRMLLLKKSARTFYLNHLDEKIYQNLGNLVRPEFKFSNFKRRLKNLMNSEFIR